MTPDFDPQELEAAFQYGHHSGFHVYVGNRIRSDDESGLENLAKYIVRACFSQQRMIYIPVEKSSDAAAKVIYTSYLYIQRRPVSKNI